MRTIGNGRFDLSERIAAGGMGEVWKGLDTALGRTVAIKLLHSNLAADPKFRSRFELEARNAAALHDPRIATIFDYGDDVDPATGSHSAYLVMEYVDGVALSDLLTGPLPPERAASLVAQVADGLAIAHAAGIVHRDVKPANFLVTAGDKVKVTDFGIARALGATALTDSGTIMGTPHYVAPEVAEGQEATPASDIYSLGVVLYECVSGRKPFVGDTPVAVVLAHLRDQPPPLPASVPPQLAALVESAMAKDPAQRPPSAGQFAAALRSAVAGTPEVAGVGAGAATAVLPSAAAPVTRVLAPSSGTVASPARRRWWPVAAVAAAVLLIAGIAWALNSDNEAVPGAQDRSALSGTGNGTGQSPVNQATTTPQRETPTTPANQTPSITAARPSQTPAGDAVEGSDYVGWHKKNAEEQLKDLGFDVHSENVGGGEKDIVAEVAPAGALAPGTEVTLYVYDGKPPEEDDGGEPPEKPQPPKPPKEPKPPKGPHEGKG